MRTHSRLVDARKAALGEGFGEAARRPELRCVHETRYLAAEDERAVQKLALEMARRQRVDVEALQKTLAWRKRQQRE